MKNYTWSYDKESVPTSIKLEYVLKYGDLDEIAEVIEEFGIEYCRDIWIKKIISDRRFNKLNYFLARFIFNISSDRNIILKFLEENQRWRFKEVKPELARNKS
ncbi:MAG TPA: hypothetical protein VKD08_11140 [Ignavibacteriaceae bacterium]|nr:hypothetical protein [Ignavibacteriaceae bacterium]